METWTELKNSYGVQRTLTNKRGNSDTKERIALIQRFIAIFGKGLTVIITELSAKRKEKAIEAGVADYVLDPSQVDVVAEVMKITEERGVDVAFECSSVNKVMDTLVAAMKPTGVVVIVSIWSHPATINVHSVVMKELDIRGTIAYVNDHQETIRLVEQDKINLEPFITQRIALDDLVSKGFETLIHNNESAVKIIVHP